MRARGFNELKRTILSAVAARGRVSPRTLALVIGYNRRSMYSQCARLCRWRLLRRRFYGRGSLTYSLTAHGARRLAWLNAGSPRNRIGQPVCPL